MGLVQLLTALYSYRFTSNVRRKIKAKPLMTPRLHPLALAGLGETAEGEAASCVWVTRMSFFGGENHPILQNLCIYMQVLDAGKVYI